MQTQLLMLVLGALSIAAYYAGHHRAVFVVQGKIRDLHSLPSYYGLYMALWCVVPAFIVFMVWSTFETAVIARLVFDALPPEFRGLGPENLVMNDIKNLVNGNVVSEDVGTPLRAAADHFIRLQSASAEALWFVVISLSVGTGAWGFTRIKASQRARNTVERFVMLCLMLCASIAIFTTMGIVFSVLFESLRFFQAVSVQDFLLGLRWSPQTAIRADQVGSSGAFGTVPLFVGTLLISFIAMIVAVPIGLQSAIYLSEYASPRFRAIVKPLIEILAGIPTVVYGFFASLSVAPLIRDAGGLVGLDVASESALAAGLVMGIMIIPFVSSLSDDVIHAVPQSLRDGAYALGATRSETVRRVIIPAALPGIVGGVLLAVPRAIGETMIVVMAAGLAANLTLNPLKAVTTVTVQMVTLLTGDQEFDSPKTLAAFALGLLLFLVTLILNVIALHVVRKYREQYE